MNTAKKILCFFVVVLSLAFSASQASGAVVVVTVNNINYTLTTANLSYSGNVSLFQSQPWWGNAALANDISTQLQYQLGDLFGGPGSSPGIPSALVAYGISGGDVSITFWDGSSVIDCPSGCPAQSDVFFYVKSTSAAGAAVPTLSEWSLIILTVLIGLLGIYSTYRRYA